MLPVMMLEFVNILFKHGANIEKGVAQKCVALKLKKGKYICSSHCQIEVGQAKYTVLWKVTQRETSDSPLPAL